MEADWPQPTLTVPLSALSDSYVEFYASGQVSIQTCCDSIPDLTDRELRLVCGGMMTALERRAKTKAAADE